MVQCYACGTILPKHQKWCKPQECEVCGRAFRGAVGGSNCVFCTDPKNKKQVMNKKGVYVPFLDKDGKSALNPKTGLVK